MRRFLLLPLLLLPAGAIRADEVRLLNGRTLEGVIAAESDTEIELRFPGGSLSIARSSVREIVRSESPYAEYQSRAGELRRGGAGALRWVELARWARSRQMETAAREAALEAARLDPGLAELAPVMRSFGYELDEPSGRWLPYDEAMRSRGLVPVDGNWLTREEAAELRRRSEEAERERETDRIERAAAEMRLAAAEMEASRAREPTPFDYGAYWWGTGYVPYYPAYWPIGHPGVFPGGRPDRPHVEPRGHDRRPDRVQSPPPGGTSHGGMKTAPGGSRPGSPGARAASGSRRP